MVEETYSTHGCCTAQCSLRIDVRASDSAWWVYGGFFLLTFWSFLRVHMLPPLSFWAWILRLRCEMIGVWTHIDSWPWLLCSSSFVWQPWYNSLWLTGFKAPTEWLIKILLLIIIHSFPLLAVMLMMILMMTTTLMMVMMMNALISESEKCNLISDTRFESPFSLFVCLAWGRLFFFVFAER